MPSSDVEKYTSPRRPASVERVSTSTSSGRPFSRSGGELSNGGAVQMASFIPPAAFATLNTPSPAPNRPDLG